MEASSQRSISRRSRGLLVVKGLVAIIVSVVAFWYAFRGVPMEEVMHGLKNSSIGIIVLYAAAQFVIQGFRVLRWQLLVKPLGNVSFRAVAASANIGIPAAMFLPLRLGEFVRPIMISRSGVPFAGAMAALVVERIMDGVVNVALFFALLMMLPESALISDDLKNLGMIALVVFGGAFVFLIVAIVVRDPAVRFVERALSLVSTALAEKVVALLSKFLDGASSLRSPLRWFGFVGLTIAYWAVNGFFSYLIIQSYGADVPFIAGPFTISVVVFAVMVPAGPAFAGTLEAGFRFGLLPFGVGLSTIAVAAIAVHVLAILTNVGFAVLGILFAEPKQTEEGALIAPPPRG